MSNINEKSPRRFLYVDTEQKTFLNDLGPQQPFTSFESLLQRRIQLEEQQKQSNDSTEQLETKPAFLPKTWCAAQTKVDKALNSDISNGDKQKKSRKLELQKCIELYGHDAVIAAMAYSMADPELKVYNRFNLYTKAGSNLSSRFKASLIHADFVALFEHLVAMQEKAPLIKSTTVYRGIQGQLKAFVGQVITLGHFVSTSVNQEVAMNFLKHSGNGKTNNTKYLLQYTGPLLGINMAPMSDFPDESEVLLFPYQSFVVSDIVQYDWYTLVKLHSQTENAVQMLTKIIAFYPDLALSITSKQKLAKTIFTIFDDQITSSNAHFYMISSTDLKHFDSIFDKTTKSKPLKKTQFYTDLKLPNAYIYVFRQIKFNELIQDNYNPNGTPILKLITKTIRDNLELIPYRDRFKICFTTLVPNIHLLIASMKTNEPIYCKVETNVHCANQNIYTEPDCFLYTLSSEEVSHLCQICVKQDVNATSFIICKKELFAQSKVELFEPLFPKENYPDIKVAHVEKYWDNIYTDYNMYTMRNPNRKTTTFFQREPTDILPMHNTIFGLPLTILWGFVRHIPSILWDYKYLTAVQDVCVFLSMIVMLLNGVEFLYRVNTKKKYTFINWFLCKKCGRRCNEHCLKNNFIKKLYLFVDLTMFSKLLMYISIVTTTSCILFLFCSWSFYVYLLL